MASAPLAEILCSLTPDDLQFGSASQLPTPKVGDYLTARNEEARPISIEEYDSDRLLAGSTEFVSTDESPEAFEEIDENRGGPEAELEQAENIESLALAIEKLPERSQQILALYYQEEMNLKEIGEILSVSESRISQILSETAGKLRRLMSS